MKTVEQGIEEWDRETELYVAPDRAVPFLAEHDHDKLMSFLKKYTVSIFFQYDVENPGVLQYIRFKHDAAFQFDCKVVGQSGTTYFQTDELEVFTGKNEGFLDHICRKYGLSYEVSSYVTISRHSASPIEKVDYEFWRTSPKEGEFVTLVERDENGVARPVETVQISGNRASDEPKCDAQAATERGGDNA